MRRNLINPEESKQTAMRPTSTTIVASGPVSRIDSRLALCGPLPLVIWTPMPTHHQSAFFEALRAAGVRLQVCYFAQVSAERRALGWDVPVRLPEGERYVSPTLASLRLVGRWADHVHVVGGANRPFLQALVLALSIKRVPWVHWSERGTPRRRWGSKAVQRRLYAALVNRCGLGAFAIGDMARDDFERWGMRRCRIRLLPYSIAGLQSDRTTMARRGSVRFIQVGELCPRKGVDVLLQAFARLHRAYPATRLELVGSGPSESEYRELAATLGIVDAVDFRGAVPAAAVADAMGEADVVVLASRFDGWGVVLNEGASLGKALVSTDATGAAQHLIRVGENGFRVAADDIAALHDALECYCRDPGLATLHGRRSAQIFEDYTPAANAARLRRGLAALLDGR